MAKKNENIAEETVKKTTKKAKTEGEAVEKTEEEIAEILETGNPAFKGYPDLRIMASEDMAVVSRHLPTTYIMLNCKVEGNNFSHHNPGVLFDEAALPIGAGSFATVGIEWLKKHSA